MHHRLLLLKPSCGNVHDNVTDYHTMFLTKAVVRDHVSHAVAEKTHWLKTFLSRLMGRCLSKKISLYFPKTLHLALFLAESSCLVLFSIAIVCPTNLQLFTFSIPVRSICMLSAALIFVTNLVFPCVS